MSTLKHPSLHKEEAWLEIVRSKVQGVRFGIVQLVVHEGRVTQIEVTEKTRLDDQSGVKTR